MIAAVPHVAAMAPYALASLQAAPGKRLISLSQNESLRPPSPEAIRAAGEAVQSARLYPDPDWRALRAGLAALHDIPETGLLCGNGSMELIAALVKVFAGHSAAVLAPAHAYPFFRSATQMVGARYDTAEEREGHVDVDALLAAVTAQTTLVFVANPGNPTGTRISRAELIRLREGLPGSVLLVIDEAYGEFADHLAEPMFDLVARGDTVVLRSFSKAYGLAGLRVGWGLFPPGVAQEVRKVMNPNSVTAAGQAAAQAALEDQAYMRKTCALTAQQRDAFAARLGEAGLRVAPSFTNFVLIRFDTATRAAEADAALRAEGVILRGQGGVGLPEALRATIGAPEEMAFAADVLARWAGETGA